MSVDTKELRSFHGWTSRTDSERLDVLRSAADCIDSQSAEIERLRDALEFVAEIYDDEKSSGENAMAAYEARNMARFALSGEKK